MSATSTKISNNQKMVKRLLENGRDQHDTENEMQVKNHFGNMKRQLAAEKVQGLVYYINKSFLELARTLAKTGNREQAAVAAALLFGVDKISEKMIERIFEMGDKLNDCSEYVIHKLSFSPLFLAPNESSLKVITNSDADALERFKFEPDKHLTILYKSLQCHQK